MFYYANLFLLKERKLLKKRLKITKKQSQVVNRRITDNTLTKRKRRKGQTTISKTIHTHLKIEQHQPHLNRR
jgi:hypothetical protein